MFGKLKNKLKSWVGKVSKKEEEIEEKIVERPRKEKIEKPKEKPKKKEKKEKKQIKKDKKKEKEEQKKVEEKQEEKLPELEEVETISELIKEPEEISKPDLEKVEEQVQEKKKRSFFKKITTSNVTISKKSFEDYAEELETLLVENNVALEVVDKILKYLGTDLIGQSIPKKKLEYTINQSLKEIIQEVLVEPFDLLKKIKSKPEKPFIILFCGINGTGKTTGIAKIANMLKKQKMSSVIAAADTFRAASIEQIKKHGEKLDIKVISHEYGSDPAAVGFDAIKYAKKNKTDTVLIDTAGRMHTAINLIREIAKIKKVCKPDLTIFVGESITGNDATEQVRAFNDAIGIDAIILSKADIDEKGGTALSVGHTTNKPIIYLGTGQEYDDLEKFDKAKFIEKLGL